MKRKLLSISLLFALLFTLFALPTAAYVRISYGLDCLASCAELIKTGLRGETLTFSETDFCQALGLPKIREVAILTLPEPASGVLNCNGTPVTAGQVVNADALGTLTFCPASEAVERATFTFAANLASGTTAITCTIRLVDRVNAAPTVTDPSLSLSTRAGIALYGRLSAEDPEGDDFAYLVVAYPRKGRLTLSGKTGEYRYLPTAGTDGEDAFSYVVRDACGNYSHVATVTLTVEKRNSTLVYADLDGDPAHNAALCVSEKGIMMGVMEGDDRLFLPEGSMTRAAFLTAAMKSAGIRPSAGVKATWFDDDTAIKAGERPYVATAQLLGYVCGTFNGEGLYFGPNEPITRAEAAVIVDRVLGLAHPASVQAPDGTPRFARPAVAALASEKVMTFSAPTDGALTRREAAVLLSAMLDYCKN